MFEDDPKPFIEHLEELRVCILKCLGALTVGMILAAVFTNDLLALLRSPLDPALKEHQIDPGRFLFMMNPLDPMTLTFQTALFGGILFALPFMLFFIGQYLLPALSPRERRMLLPGAAVGCFLFILGVAFCYWIVLPRTMQFLIAWSFELGAEPRYPYQEYIGMVVQLLAGFGAAFELPLIIAVLAKLGVINSRFLATWRRHAVIVLLVLSAIITPTSDPFTLCAMAVPLYVLYEAGIVAAWWIERRAAASDKVAEDPPSG
ncbi:MAG: twin-arginine translocase subunit TatC [Candidatus Methylacidiphilales bacterium]|nr:twin-arginine translocase subunit TatC [Candidatus Methylacidiphilales bacterium]